MNNKNTILLAVVALGAIGIFKFMAGQMVPYVPFTQAVARSEYVQILGKVDTKKGIEHRTGAIRFTLLDGTGKDSIDIEYAAEQPLQLEQAEKVVAIGTYDAAAKIFKADKILTKCPSKYEKKEFK